MLGAKVVQLKFRKRLVGQDERVDAALLWMSKSAGEPTRFSSSAAAQQTDQASKTGCKLKKKFYSHKEAVRRQTTSRISEDR
jgi:hypothetical protein